jgi:hypothetical protein
MGFTADLRLGEEIEEKLLAVIRKKHPSAVKIPKKFSAYDIFIPENGKKIEVKYDKKSNETGNIVIEIEMFGKPSGLMATEADWWVFYDDNDFMAISPKDITYFLFINRLIHTEFVGSGDNQKKKAFLVPKDKLFKSCIRFQA